MRIAFFAPCYVDQLYPRAAIAALDVLERLGLEVEVPLDAVCCGQPPANAGFERAAVPTLERFVRTFDSYDKDDTYETCEHVVMLSGSCAFHVRAHAASIGAAGARVAGRAIEFCAFLHDVVGVDAVRTLGAQCRRRVAVHIGCHAVRGLSLAAPTELCVPRFDKVRALLGTVSGLSFADLARPDECCGFGGSFSVGEPAVSGRMGRDRIGDCVHGGAEAVVSTDMSCLMHLEGLARQDERALPMMHVAEVLAARPA